MTFTPLYVSTLTEQSKDSSANAMFLPQLTQQPVSIQKTSKNHQLLVSARIFLPRKPDSKRRYSVLVYYHGGGFFSKIHRPTSANYQDPLKISKIHRQPHSLWHIRRFQDDVQRLSVHANVDDPFVVCALCDILVAQNAQSVNKEREAHPLTVAIRKTVSCFFNKGPNNDASEVLGIILAHFHQVLVPSQDVFVTESVESNHPKSSINLFKLDVIESMACYHCGLTSRYRKYTSFFHKINANDLGKAKLWFPTYSFDELLNLVEINHQLACDPKAKGCGALNHIEHVLTTSPHVFTAFIEWQNNYGNCEDIAQIVEAICTSIDVRLLYRGLNTEHRHHLVCMVCYYEQHYCCFGYNEKDGMWIIHDDKTIKMVGEWKDVVVMCKTENMKPHVLFFEADTD